MGVVGVKLHALDDAQGFRNDRRIREKVHGQMCHLVCTSPEIREKVGWGRARAEAVDLIPVGRRGEDLDHAVPRHSGGASYHCCQTLGRGIINRNAMEDAV